MRNDYLDKLYTLTDRQDKLDLMTKYRDDQRAYFTKKQAERDAED